MADQPHKEPVSGWERARTFAIMVSSVTALVTVLASAVAFVTAYFATESELRGVKEVQNRLIACIEDYAVPLDSMRIEQSRVYANYVNDKTNTIALIIEKEEGNASKIWWFSDIKSETVDQLRDKAVSRYADVLRMHEDVADLSLDFEEYCSRLKLERGLWDVSR